MARNYRAAGSDEYKTDVRSTGKLNALRLKAIILLMRYSGMRIGDTVSLSAERIKGDKLFLYTQKTGQPVYTVLPPAVVNILAATPLCSAIIAYAV